MTVTLEEVLRNMDNFSAEGDSQTPRPEIKPSDVQMNEPKVDKPFFHSGSDLLESAKSGLLGGAAATTDMLYAMGKAMPRPGSTYIPQAGKPPLRFDKPFRDPETNKIDWSSLLPSYDTPVSDAARENFPNTMEYDPKGDLGDLTKTTGEMALGMLFPAGPIGGTAMKLASRFGRNVFAPAVGTETAGAAARNYFPEYEGTARFLGGLGAGMFAAAPEAMLRSAIGNSATRGADLGEVANYLKFRGVNIPASATKDLPTLRAFEGATESGLDNFGSMELVKQYNKTIAQDIGNPQLERFTPDVTDSVTGVTRKGTLSQQREAIGNKYDQLSQGVDIPIVQSHVDDVNNILTNWTNRNNITTLKTPFQLAQLQRVLNLRNATGQPLSASELRNLRSQLGALARDSDSNQLTASSARQAVEVLDGALEDTLTATGRADVAAEFKKLNRQYRNLLVTESAANKFSAPGVYRSNGLIDPKAMSSAADHMGFGPNEAINKTAKSLEDTGTGLGGPREVVPTNIKRGISIGDVVTSAIPSVGYSLLSGVTPSFDPKTMAILAASLAIPKASSIARNTARQGAAKFLASDLGQQYALRATERGMINPLPSGAFAATNDNRMGRKAGGKVSSHEMAADQLVRAAERAKKGLSAHTEGLLNTPDEAVASALEIANRSI